MWLLNASTSELPRWGEASLIASSYCNIFTTGCKGQCQAKRKQLQILAFRKSNGIWRIPNTKTITLAKNPARNALV